MRIRSAAAKREFINRLKEVEDNDFLEFIAAVSNTFGITEEITINEDPILRGRLEQLRRELNDSKK